MTDETKGLGRRTFLGGVAAAVVARTALAAPSAGPNALPVSRSDGAPNDMPNDHHRGAADDPSGTADETLSLFVAARAPSTPTGVVVSRGGRVFVFMPRVDDRVPYTVGEVARDGTVTPYPSAAMNDAGAGRAQDALIHVPNGVVDGRDRLWLLDAGLMRASGAPVPGGAKLVCVDLAANRVERTISLGAVVEPTSSLNDLRVDAGRGRPERAYVTDQGQDGRGAVIAVDLATGRAVRRLAGHGSTTSQAGVVKIVEGRQLLRRSADGSTRPVQGGANGIALSADGRRLWYAPLMGRHLYAVATDVLLDPAAGDAAVAAAVEELGEKGLTGGLLADAQDRVYLALQELNAIGRRERDGTITVLVQDPRLVWPDTMWITPDRWLYISAAQVNRRPEYNGGVDRQRPPYAILRMRVDADPA